MSALTPTPTPTPTPTSASPPFPDQLSFLSDICGSLKTIRRTGWVRSGIPLPESDADHMHRCAMCALLVAQPPHHDDLRLYTTERFRRFDPSKVDSAKLLRMAVTHDLCESLAGDVTPHCHPDLIDAKEAREDAAMREIRSVVSDPLGEELYDLWREYEDQETTEAIYCRDIDKFEMVCQAYEYERAHLSTFRGDFNDAETGARREEEARRCDGDGGGIADADKSAKEVDGAAPAEEGRGRGREDCLTSDGALAQPLRTFFVSTNGVLRTPLFRRLDGEVRDRREALLQERGWDVTDEERQKYEE